MNTVYLNDWSKDYKWGDRHELEAMISDFEIESTELVGVTVLLASYSYENYSGDAFVLFEKEGKLFEVNGGHCSCYGLEGQWNPEECTSADIWHRLEHGELGTGYGCNEFSKELREVMNALYPKDSETTE